MPLTDTEPRLPFSGRSPLAKQASHDAAVAAAPTRATKTATLLALYRRHGPLSDHEVAAMTGWPHSSVTSIRNGCGGKVRAVDFTVSPYKKRCTRWELTER